MVCSKLNMFRTCGISFLVSLERSFKMLRAEMSVSLALPSQCAIISNDVRWEIWNDFVLQSQDARQQSWTRSIMLLQILFMIYDERNNSFISTQLAIVKQRQNIVRMINDENRVDLIYVEKVVTAHIMMTWTLSIVKNALTNSKIDNEALHIFDSDLQPFLDFSRQIWTIVRFITQFENVAIIPAWIALSTVSTLKSMMFLLIFEQKRL